MSNTSGVYLRAPGRPPAPGALVSVSVARWQDRELTGGGQTTTARFYAARVAASRIVRGHWSETIERDFDRPDQFWRWLNAWAECGRKTYVVSPLASDALTYLGFWELVDAFGAQWSKNLQSNSAPIMLPVSDTPYTFRRLVLKGAPDIIDYTSRGRSYCWLSVKNYFQHDYKEAPTPHAGIDGAIGAALETTEVEQRDRHAAEAVTWLVSFQKLADWWREIDGGPWAATAGALSERFMRSRMALKAVATHRNPAVQRLERLAAHRGRTSCSFAGSAVAPDATPDDAQAVPTGPFPVIPSEIIHIDVRSMYPYLLTATDLPVRLRTHMANPQVETVKQLCDAFVCTAAVRMNTKNAEYPCRTKDGVIYPTGKFTSYLSGADLKRALADGDVSHIYECAVYQSGRPFARAAEELMELRKRPREDGNEGWELFVKLLANSMTGKLAQRRSRWVERPNHPPEMRWGTWSDISLRDGTRRQFRALAALVWEQVTEESGTGLLTACYGHLTAACSSFMRRVREALPPRCVLSQDTDGVWCTPDAEVALRSQGFQFGDEPGCLRITKRSRYSRFWGAKHYFAARHWTLSGLGSPVRVSDGLTFLDQTSVNPVRGSPLAPPTLTVDSLRSITLNALVSDGTVGADGWVSPRAVGVPIVTPPPADEVEQRNSDSQNKNSQSLFD